MLFGLGIRLSAEIDFLGHLEEQVQKLAAYNQKCLEQGRTEKTVYFFVYEPGKDLYFNEVADSYDWFNYYLLPASGTALFDEHSLSFLNNQLRAFNQNGEETASGAVESVEVYAFFINDFKGYINAKPEQLLRNREGSVLDYLAAERDVVGPEAYRDYQFYKAALKQRINNFEFGVGDNKLLVYGSGFKAYQWKETYERIYSINTSAKGSYLERSAACRRNYQEQQFKHRQFPFAFPTSSKASRHFANAILSQLEFLSSPELQNNCESCGPTIAGYLEDLWNPTARDFLLERCAQLKDHPERLHFAFRIAEFIQSLGMIYEDYEGQSLPPDEYNWAGEWEEYLHFEAALRNHETELITAHERLRAAIAEEDWYQVFLTLYHFQRPIFFQQLAVADRIRAIEILAKGPMFGYWLLGDHEELVFSLLEQVPDEPLYVEQFLNGIRHSPDLLKTLFHKINNHWVGEASRFHFISSLNTLIKKRPESNQVYTDYTIIWDLPDQRLKNSFTYDCAFTETGALDFSLTQCVAVENYYTGNNFTENAHLMCIEQETTVWEEVAPYALLDIAVIDRITVIDLCSQDGCQGKLFREVPALLAAYLIRQTAQEDRLQQIMTSLEIIGLSLGVGELALALRLQSRVRLLIAGYLLGSDMASVAIGSEAFRRYLLDSLGEEDGQQLYEHFLFYNSLNSLIAGSISLVAVEDAAKAVASVEKLKKIGIPIEEVEEQLGFSIGSLSGQELKQLSQAMERELNSTEQGRKALRAAKASLGLDELAHLIDQLKNAGASEELIDKIILMPLNDIELLLSQLLRNNHRVIPKFNALPAFVDLWQRYRYGKYGEDFLQWDESLFYQHFSDLNWMSLLNRLFEEHPRMIRAYALLWGDGSFDYLPFRTNVQDIKRIDELAEVYPEQLPQLALDFSAAPDKRGFLDQLLGPGKPGEKVSHKVKGLMESIDIHYQPADVHLSDFEGSPTVIYTLVGPPQGGKPGHYKRYWEPANQTFVLDEGFRYDAPKWIKDVPVPLIEGKGIPTSTYVTLRQMKYLQIPEGSLAYLKLSTVQNAEIMRDIYYIMQEQQLTNLQEVANYLLSKSGIQYASTMIKQAGYDITDVEILTHDYTRYETALYMRDKKKIEEINDSWLQQNNLSWESKLYVHFDVLLELSPIP